MDLHVPEDVARDIARAADAERRLLDRERRAVRALSEAEDRLKAERQRLLRAQGRVDKRQTDADAAGDRLRRRQAERAAGPPAKDRD